MCVGIFNNFFYEEISNFINVFGTLIGLAESDGISLTTGSTITTSSFVFLLFDKAWLFPTVPCAWPVILITILVLVQPSKFRC